MRKSGPSSNTDPKYLLNFYFLINVFLKNNYLLKFIFDTINIHLKPAEHDACFPAGLRFSKLLEILPSV